MVGGRLSDGSATWEWQISDGYYALVDISRSDGKKLTEEEEGKETTPKGFIFCR